MDSNKKKKFHGAIPSHPSTSWNPSTSLLLLTYYQFLIVFPLCLRHVPPLPARSLTKQP